MKKWLAILILSLVVFSGCSPQEMEITDKVSAKEAAQQALDMDIQFAGETYITMVRALACPEELTDAEWQTFYRVAQLTSPLAPIMKDEFLAIEVPAEDFEIFKEEMLIAWNSLYDEEGNLITISYDEYAAEYEQYLTETETPQGGTDAAVVEDSTPEPEVESSDSPPIPDNE